MSSMATQPAPELPSIRVLCVDDNQHVAEAMGVKIGRARGLKWLGWLPSADALVAAVERDHVDVVVLDVDMPGPDPLRAVAELRESFPETRTLIFSGHVRFELVERALEAGAWGYVSKNDGEDALIQAVREVVAGELALSSEALAAFQRDPPWGGEGRP